MTDRTCMEIIKEYTRKLAPIPSGYKPVLSRLPDIKVILFDIYGTLLTTEVKLPAKNDEADEHTAINLARLIGKYRLQYSVKELLTAYRTEVTEASRLAASQTSYPEVDIIRIWAKLIKSTDTALLRQLALEFELIVRRVWPSGDLPALFGYLKQRKIRLGIISNAQFYSEIILEYFLKQPLIQAGFDKTLIIYSYKLKTAKPASELFALASAGIAGMGFNNEEVLFIGNDPVNDILPAQSPGFKTALFAGDLRSVSAGKEQAAVPDIIITDWQQIKEIV